MRSLVLGGGLGGLSAAIHLAQRGHEVTVLERNDHAGGKCDRHEEDGFHFDIGPSVLTLPFVLDELFAAAGRRREDFLSLHPVEPGCTYFFADGTRFDAPGSAEAMEEAIARTFPGEERGFQRFWKHAERLWKVSGPAFLFHPPGPRALRDIPYPRAVRALPDLLPVPMGRRLRHFFRDPRLVQLFSRFATYNGSDPARTPGTFNVIAYAELAFGSWRCEGGMRALVDALVQLAADCGVEFVYNCEAERILFDRAGRVRGVRTAAGEEIAADRVVCNQDAVSARNGPLLAEHPRARRLRVPAGEPSSSGFVLLVAHEGTRDDLSCHNVFFPADYGREFRELFRSPQPLGDPTLYLSRPSSLDPALAPAGAEGWFVLVNAPSLAGFQAWKEEDYAGFLLERLQERAGLDPSRVRWHRAHGPSLYRERYRSWEGTLYGLSSNTLRQAFLRPANRLPAAPGLSFAGGSSHPGGGIPLVLLSGRFAAEAVA